MSADPYDVLLNSFSPTPAPAPKVQPSVDYRQLYNQVGQKYGVDSDLLYNQAKHESVDFNPTYVYGPRRSPKGAAGLAQFMPDTARQYGLRVGKGQDDRFNPQKAADAHARLMKDLIDKYGDAQLALAAYNSGTNKTSVQAQRAMQRIPETRKYVQKIAPQGDAYDQLLNEQGGQTPKRDDYDSLLDSILGQTPPPVQASVNQPLSPATTPPAQPRQPSVPSLVLPRGQRNQGAAYQPKFGGGQPYPDESGPSEPIQLEPGGKGFESPRKAAIREQVKQRYLMPERLPKTVEAETEARFQSGEDEAARRAAQEPEVAQLTNQYRQLIRAMGTTSGSQWAQEAIAKGLGGLLEYAPAAIRWMSPPTAITAALLGRRTQDADLLAKHAEAIHRAAQEEGVNRNAVSKAIQDAVGGGIAGAPEMALTSLGVPAPVAFGAGGATRAVGRGEGLSGALKAGAESAVSAAPFEVAPPAIQNRLLRSLARGAEVGTGTGALELARGATPQQAASAALTNAAFAGTGEAGRRATPEPVAESQTQVLDIDATLAARERVQPTFLRDDSGTPIARVLNPDEVAQGAKPKIRPIHQADTQARDEVGRFAPSEPEPEPVPAQVESGKPSEPSPREGGEGAATEPLAPPESTPTQAPEGEGVRPPTTGIAHRVETATRGEEPQRGQAIGAEESIERGRQLLKEGADPQEAIDKFKETGAISPESIALVRAKHEELAQVANQAFDAGGLDSPAFKVAEKARTDFYDQSVKPMQTAWSNTGRAQQGETDIDTGTFYGLYRGFKDAKGREPSKAEASTLQRFAQRSAKSEADVKDLSTRLAAELDKASKVSDLPKPVQQSMARFIEQAQREARREGRRTTRKSLDDEAVVIKQNLAVAFQKAKSGQGIQPSGFARFDPEGEITKQVIAYAKNRVKAGVTDISQLIDDVHSTVKDFAADVTKREVTEALLGQGMPKSPRVESEWAQVKKGLKEQLRNEDGTIARDELGKRLQGNPKQLSKEDAAAVWQYARENYLDKGNTDFADLTQKTAKDLGVTPETVRRALASTKASKRISNEMYARMSERRQAQQNAKAWVQQADASLASKAFEDLRRLWFIKATLGHGVVAPFTHAPVNIFIPSRWAEFWPNFGRTYKFLVSKGGHEQAMLDLERGENYITAKRAGLANDPKRGYDEYQSPWMAKTLGKLGISGNRAFDALKTMRQDLFDSAWNKMPKADQTPEMAKLIAEEVNASTGASKALSGQGWVTKGVSKAMFAAPLEASRWDFLIRDNARALDALNKMVQGKATSEQKYLFKRVASRNAQLAATYAALLAANQGLLTATKSDDKINFTDPTRADFLAFKVGGHVISPASGMLGALRLIGTLASRAMENKKPAQKAEDVAKDVFKYGRGKLSPLYGTLTDVGMGSDFMNRPLPWSSQEGTARFPRYTWPEYLLSTQTPIPLAEGVRDVFDTLRESGMPEPQARDYIKAIAKAVPVTAVAASGIRIRKSYPYVADQRAVKQQQKATLTDQFRSGKVTSDDLQSLVEQEKLTEADKSAIEKAGNLTDTQVQFDKAFPSQALDRYERMTAPQRSAVEDLMTKKGKSLVTSKSLTQSQRDAFRQRLEKVGIYVE